MFIVFFIGIIPALLITQWRHGNTIFLEPDYYKWRDGTYHAKPEPQRELTWEEWLAIWQQDHPEYFK
jgi:hypothetical protein